MIMVMMARRGCGHDLAMWVQMLLAWVLLARVLVLVVILIVLHVLLTIESGATLVAGGTALLTTVVDKQLLSL